jgi:hypothetical protein
MTGVSSLAFPGSRTLANWWRQLAPYQPEAIWTGYLFLHRVEAKVALLESQPLDRLSHLFLQAVDLETKCASATPPSPPCEGGAWGGRDLCEALQDRLRLGTAVIRQMLRTLAGHDLLRAQDGGPWTLTDLGRYALAHQCFALPHQERRSFPFVERFDAAGRRVSPPHFLGVAETAGVPWEAAEAAVFDVQMLRACPGQPPEWKARFGFPLEVQAVLGPSDNGSWQEVVVDRPERVLAVLVEGKKGSDEPRLLGFPARPDGWVLESREPILNLPAAARSFAPELADEPSPETWRQAWQAWCQIRQLPQADVAACQLTHAGARLRVAASQRLEQRLQTARSDIFKGDAWVLAGEGYLRPAVCLELQRW